MFTQWPGHRLVRAQRIFRQTSGKNQKVNLFEFLKMAWTKERSLSREQHYMKNCCRGVPRAHQRLERSSTKCRRKFGLFASFSSGSSAAVTGIIAHIMHTHNTSIRTCRSPNANDIVIGYSIPSTTSNNNGYYEDIAVQKYSI